MYKTNVLFYMWACVCVCFVRVPARDRLCPGDLVLGDVQLLGGGLILDTSPITGKVFFKVPSPSLLSLPFAGLLCACMCFLWSSSSRFLSSVHRAFLMKKIRLGRYCFIVILLHSSPAHCVVYLPIGCAFFIGVAGTFFCFLLKKHK